MPKFHWKGRSAAGHEIEGDTSAASHEAVVAQLRGQGIMVTTISTTGGQALEVSGSDMQAPAAPRALSASERLARDRASSKPRPLRGALIASCFFVAALALGYFVPVTFVRCERSAGSVACTLREKDLGLFTVREQSLSGVTKVEVEARVQRFANGRSQSRLVLANATGASIRPSVWDRYGDDSGGRNNSVGEPTVGATTDAMRREIAAFLEDSTSASVSSWQGLYLPLVIAGVLAGVGLLSLTLSALALFKGPTDLIYAMAGRMAAAADARRQQRGH